MGLTIGLVVVGLKSVVELAETTTSSSYTTTGNKSYSFSIVEINMGIFTSITNLPYGLFSHCISGGVVA